MSRLPDGEAVHGNERYLRHIYNVSSGVTETGDYVAQTGLISVSEGGEVKGDHLGLVVGSFKTSIDGTGGTIVTDPPVANSAGLKPH